MVRLDRTLVRQEDTVWVMEGDSLRIRDVEIVLRDARYAYISAGLEAGDRILAVDGGPVADWIELPFNTVFPWDPATAMPYFNRISSASISARGTTGTLPCRAATTSGFSSSTALELTTTSALPMFSPAWPMNSSTPRR